jgi:hypothetical protein
MSAAAGVMTALILEERLAEGVLASGAAAGLTCGWVGRLS